MFTLKFLILSIKILTHTSEYLSGNQMHSWAAVWYVFSLSTRHITDHIPFRRLFHYHERQNVGSKSDILKMFHNLKPRTIFISTRGRSIPLFILQLIEKLSIINVVRAKTQKRILWWVCLKVSKMILFQSIWRKRQFINLWFLT